MSLQTTSLDTQPPRRRLQRKTKLGDCFIDYACQSYMSPSGKAVDTQTRRHRMRTKTSSNTLSSLTDTDVFDGIIRYSGLCGFVPIECASRQHHQRCNDQGLVRSLCEDVGVHVKHAHCSIKKLKQVCFVALNFPGEAWNMTNLPESDNFIKCGLRAISTLPKDAGPWRRVSSFHLTPADKRHLIHMIEGLENNPDTYQPLPDAPYIDSDHEFYLQLAAPLFMQVAEYSVVFGFVDLYITWEASELIFRAGLSMNNAIVQTYPRLRSLTEEIQKKIAILYPVDHRDGVSGKLHRSSGGIHLGAFGFGYRWFDRKKDAPKILAIIRSLVAEGQLRCLLALQNAQTATA